MILPPKDFITTKEAARLSGYSADYIARLARSGVLKTKRVGRAWFVETVSLEEFARSQGTRKDERLRALAEERIAEYRSSQIVEIEKSYVVKDSASAQPAATIRGIRAITAARQAAYALIALLVVATGAFAAESPVADRVALVAAQTATGFRLLTQGAEQDIDAHLADATARTDDARDRITLGTDTIPAQDLALLPPRDILARATAPTFAPLALATTSTSIPNATFADLALLPLALAKGEASLTHALVTGETRAAYAYATVLPQAALGTTQGALALGAAVGRTAAALPALALSAAGQGARAALAAAAALAPRVPTLAPLQFAFALPAFPRLPSFALPSLASTRGFAAAALANLSLGERAALSTYLAIHGLIASTTSYLADVFTPTAPPIETPLPVEPPVALATTTAPAPAPVPVPAPTAAPAPALAYVPATYVTNNTYVTQGITQADLDQALSSLRLNLYGAIGNVGPAHEPDTIQHGVSITSQAGTFDTLTVGGATSVGTLTVGNTTIGSGTLATAYASTTVLTVAGPAYFGATATSTFAADGSLTLSHALGTASGGTGTTTWEVGSIPFANGTNLTEDNNNLFWDAADKRLGIGTNAPSETLTVGGVVRVGTADDAGLIDLGDTLTGSGNYTNGIFRGGLGTTAGGGYLNLGAWNGIAFNTSGTWLGSQATRMVIDGATGNVGIGTTSPGTALSVAGDGYLTGALGVGVATTTPGVLQTAGNAWIGGDLTVTGNSTVLGNSTVIGNSSTGDLVINSHIKSDIVPDQNDTYNLGSPSFYWGNAYVANLNVNNISAASTTIGGTSDNSFTINSNNATADAESAQLIFFRGTVVPNALLSWNAAGNAKRFEFNQPLYIQNASGSTTIPTLALASVAGQTANIVNVASSSGASLFSIGPDGSVNQGTTTVNGNLTVTGASTFGSAFNVNGLSTFTNASTSQLSVFNNAWFGATATSTFTSQGYLGIGSTSPWAALSVNPNGLAGPAFAVGSSTSTDLVVTNGGSVGIGTANPSTALEVVGDITSKGTAWTGRTAASNNLWNSVAYGNGTFVAVASSGSGNRVMTSPDGVTWTSRTSAANLSWLSVTYGAGEFVAVASYNGVTNNLVMTSPDGVNWTQRTAAAGLNWSSVTYGAGTFVAVANDGVTGSVMTSPDGVNWTLRSAASANDWDAVTYGNGTFVAVASSGSGNRVMTSPDGVTWTSRTSAADSTWDALTYGNGLFIAANSDGGTGGIMTSPDGSAWTLRTTPSGFGWQSVAYGNGTFVAVASYGSNTLAITSPDGVTWTSRATPTGNWSGVTYGAGTFVAVSSAGSGIEAMTSGKAETTPFAANNIYQGGMDIFGNVGIGTTTPNWAATFANPNGPQLALTGTGANEWTFREAGGNLYFATSTYSATSSASALTINPNGSLGIGTTSPATTLSVAGNGYFTGGLGIGVLNTTANTLNVNNAFLVNSSGSVGIGTTSPAQTLAVQGNGYVSGNLFVGGAITATSTLTITATTTALNFIASNLGAAAAPAYTFGGNLTTGFWSPGANLLAFSTGGLERLRIDGSGNLGLGTTSPFANLSIQNNYGSTNSTLFAIASSTSSTGSSANTFLTVSNSGLLNVGTNGANYFSVDAGTGSTTIANLSLGNLAFDTDAGIVNLSDIPVDAQVSAGTPESQSIAIGGLADLTAYGEADGLGGVQNLRVGIGSSTPSALLTLQNPYGNYNTNLFTISSSTAADGSAAASLLTFTNSGKLGIGTTTPNWPLTVANASGPQLAITGTGANEWTLREAGGNLYVATSTYSATSSATALTLASSGNVGIGTTSPSQTLSVVGGSYLNGAINAGGQLFFSANGASAPYGIEKNGSSQLQFNGGSGGYIFNNAANSANLVAILDSGNVGIGTTTPGAVLTVGLNTASGGDGLLIANQNSGGWNNLDFQANNGQHAYLSYGNSTNANANRFALQVGSNTALAVDSSGNMAFGGNIGNGSSLTSVSGAAVTILSSGLVGIGTTSPYSKLTIWGSDALTGTNAFLVSNNASSTLFAIDDGGNVNIASTTATTTIAGGLNVGNGGLLYNSSTGITSAAALQVGNLNFDADSGQVSWFDMPVTSASIAGTIESYTANLNSNPALTVYGLSDGAGGITNLGVGIGTTSPYATFAVQNQYGLTQPLLFAVASSTASNGSTANNFFTVTNAGNVGIGTTTPGSNLSVVTGLSVGANYGTAAPSNGLMVQGNALFGTTTSSGLSGHNIFAGGDGNGWITNATINGSAGVLEGIRSGVAALGTIGATTLALNPDGGNVGVGTTTPWAKLSVTGAGTGTGYTFIAANSSNTPLFTIQDNGEVGISTTSPQATLGMQGSIGVNNKQLYLAANGNVGVGGQSPGAIFAVTGSNNNNEGYTALFSSENGSGSGLGNQINITNTQSAWGLLMGFDGSGVSASTYHAPNAAYAINEQAGPLYLGTSNGVMQTITAAGNVGIGTTGPLSKLDVNGGEAIGTYAGTTAAPSNGLIVSGNVGIGTTNPLDPLHVQGIGSGNGFARFTTSDYVDGSTGTGLIIGAGASTGNTYATLWVGNGGFSTLGNLVLEQNGGNVGIGTTTPSNPLDVQGIIDTAGSNAGIQFRDRLGGSTDNGSGTDWTVYNNSNILRFYHNAADKVVIDNSGNVGIGNSGPLALLSVGAGSGSNLTNNASSTIFANTGTLPQAADSFNWISEYRDVLPSTNVDRLLIGEHRTKGTTNDWTTAAWRIQPAVDFSFTGMNSNVGYIELAAGSAGTYRGIGLSGAGNTTPDFVVNSSGNVGIGTTSPAYKLEVNGTLGYSTGGYENYDNATGFLATSKVISGAGGAFGTNSSMVFNVPSSQGFEFAQHGADEMVINTGGNVGIGTTGPGFPLTVSSDSGTAGWVGRFGNAAGTIGVLAGVRNGVASIGTDGPSNLGINPDGGNVGIGTTGPLSKLDVNGGEAIGTYAGTTAAPSNGLIVSGNVGIGTTSPQSQLEVGGVAGSNISVNTNIASTISHSLYYSSGWKYLYGSSAASQIDMNVGGASGDIAFVSAPAGTVNSAATLTTNMIIKNTGNVGIGTTTPSVLLSVGNSTADNRIYVTAGPVYTELFANSSTGKGYVGTQTNSPFAIRTNDSDRVTIDTSGNVGIGTTTPANALDISSASTNVTALSIENNSSGYNAWNIQVPGSGVTGRTGNLELLRQGTATGLVINTSGNVGIGTTTPDSTLEVNGNTRIEANNGGGNSINNGQLIIRGGTDFTQQMQIGYDTTDNYGWMQAAKWGSAYENLSLNPGGGNVGIGTTSPQSTLDVQGTNTIPLTLDTSGAQSFTHYETGGGTSRGYVGYTNLGTGGLSFLNAAGVTANLLVTDTGNVGIGTTTPQFKFSVAGPDGNLALFSGVTTGVRVGGDGAAGFVDAVDPATGVTSYKKLRLNGSTLTLNAESGGNVGIGTTIPSTKLEVASTTGQIARFDGTAAQADWLSVYNGTGNLNFGTDVAGNSFLDAQSSGSKLIFDTQSVERMRIDQNGNVGIGTTSPGYPLDVKASGAIAARLYGNAGASSDNVQVRFAGQKDGELWALGSDVTGGGSTGDFEFYNLGNAGGSMGTKLTILGSGNVGIGTTSPAYKLTVDNAGSAGGVAGFENSSGECVINPTSSSINCSSDQRLKTNFVSISTTTALADIEALSPTYFNWKTEASGAPEHAGFIAQEVQPILPDLVSQGSNGYYMLDYTGFVPYLTAGIQALAYEMQGQSADIARIQGLTGLMATTTLPESPASGVAAECVAGDTKLRRRRKRADGSYAYDETDIADIAPGDEVLSLDEATGCAVYRRVNALLPRGVQEVYELRTKGGRVVRTTANHPYLVRLSDISV